MSSWFGGEEVGISMAASASPSANGAAGAQNAGNGAPAAAAGGDCSKTAQALKHNPAPGLAVEWSPEEQAILDEGLAKFVSFSPP